MANRIGSPDSLMYPATGLAQGIYSSATNGSAIEARAYSHVYVVIPVLSVTGTPNVLVQHSDDGSTGWESIPGATVALSSSDNGTNRFGQVRLAGKKAYIRIRIDDGTMTGSATCLMFGNDRSADITGTLAFDVA